jgi:signal transduction histidine kinase
MIQYLVTVVVNLIVCGISISKRQLNGAVALSLVSLCLASWMFELYLLTAVKNEKILSPFFHLFRVGMFFIPSALALFTWRLVNKKTPGFLYVVIVPGFLGAAITAFLNNTYFPTTLRPIEAGFRPEIDAVYWAFIVNFIWCMVSSLVYPAYYFFQAQGREKEKIRWLMIAMMASFISGGISLYLFQYDSYLSKFAGPATNILFISLLLYATIQHNLMDLRLALSFWATRFLLLSLFCWMYFYLTFSLDLSVDSFGGTITLMLFFVIVLELYPRMLNWVMPGSKRLFGAEGVDFDRLTAEMRLKFSRIITIKEIASCLHYLTDRVINVRHSKFLLSTEEDNKKLFLREPEETSANIELTVSSLPKKNNKVKGGFYLIDEVDESLKHLMTRFNVAGCLVFAQGEAILGVLFVETPRGRNYFRYDDVRVLEWLAEELPQTLNRVLEIESFEKELVEAKKKLSVLNIMNHYHHDIKAPLSVIDGVLTHELYDKDKQRQIILEQVALGSRLITTMASLLKGQRQRQVGPVSIQGVIEDCILIFNHVLASSAVDIGDDAVIMGDSDDLKILFINIIKNASEAVGVEGKVSIRVRAWKDNSAVRVSISDNGVGMPDDQVREMWSSGRTTKVGGSGIGLQAIKRIADEHKATIDVISHLGKGTDITLAFPLSA